MLPLLCFRCPLHVGVSIYVSVGVCFIPISFRFTQHVRKHCCRCCRRCQAAGVLNGWSVNPTGTGLFGVCGWRWMKKCTTRIGVALHWAHVASYTKLLSSTAPTKQQGGRGWQPGRQLAATQVPSGCLSSLCVGCRGIRLRMSLHPLDLDGHFGKDVDTYLLQRLLAFHHFGVLDGLSPSKHNTSFRHPCFGLLHNSELHSTLWRPQRLCMRVKGVRSDMHTHIHTHTVSWC